MAVGIGVCLARWRSFLAGRALVVIWVVTLVMSFGRTTFGSLYDIVPGSSDIFIRRFEMGVQLSGLLLAGVGLVFLGQLVLRGALALLPEERRGWVAQPAGRGIVAALCIVGLVLVLAPAWSSMDTYDGHNATNIGLQADSDAIQGPQIDQLLAYVNAHPRDASTPARRPTGARTSSSVPSRCSSTWRARTSTRWATRCARRRS